MKRKMKHVFFLGTLSLALIGAFSNNSSAEPEVKNAVVSTKCCQGGQVVGYSNDCVSGSGACLDHYCLSSEKEVFLALTCDPEI